LFEVEKKQNAFFGLSRFDDVVHKAALCGRIGLEAVRFLKLQRNISYAKIFYILAKTPK